MYFIDAKIKSCLFKTERATLLLLPPLLPHIGKVFVFFYVSVIFVLNVYLYMFFSRLEQGICDFFCQGTILIKKAQKVEKLSPDETGEILIFRYPTVK